MFIDADEIASGTSLAADICIIGAGAAGITIARALRDTGRDVILLEAGRFEPPSDSELDCYEGEAVFKPYPIRDSRLRYFGGTTNHWGGWCRPLDRVDVEGTGDSWPLSYDDLRSYFSRAARICELPSPDFDGDALAGFSGLTLIDWQDDDPFENKFFRHSPPTRFGERYREEIGQAENVRCILGANAVAMTMAGGAAQELTVATFARNAFTVGARCYVLAMGGIENARFLLHTGNDTAGSELGNSGDLLGRCFADHFGYTPGYLLAQDNLTYDLTFVDGHGITPLISVKDAAVRDGAFTNCAILLLPNASPGLIGPGYLDNPLIAAPLGTGYLKYTVRMICAPSPNLDSRIMLSDATDPLGMRQVELDWRIGDRDLDGPLLAAETLARVVGARQIGRLQVNRRPDPLVAYRTTPGMHHLGTTRMSDHPADGVVDSDCRVHGTDNLYVAGSSVFPTFGFANPTLTIIVLALRLAETMEQSL